MKRGLKLLLLFYCTAPLAGAAVAVGVTLATAWRQGDPYLAAAGCLFAGAVLGVALGGTWAARRLTKGG